MKKFSISMGAILFLGAISAQADQLVESDLERERRLSAEYVELMAQEDGAVQIEEGIVLRPIYHHEGTDRPALADTVKVIYHLMNREGVLIEESLSSDEVLAFPLSRLIQCWKLAVPQMTFGSIYKVTCPTDTAYGDRGAGDDIAPGAALTFRIVLLGKE